MCLNDNNIILQHKYRLRMHWNDAKILQTFRMNVRAMTKWDTEKRKTEEKVAKRKMDRKICKRYWKIITIGNLETNRRIQFMMTHLFIGVCVCVLFIHRRNFMLNKNHLIFKLNGRKVSNYFFCAPANICSHFSCANVFGGFDCHSPNCWMLI